MNRPLPIWIIFVVSWVISVVLAVSLWKSAEPLWFKVIASVALVIPIFGPFLFYFLNMPPKLPMRLRATMNHNGVGGRFIGFGSKQFNYDPTFEDSTASEGSNGQTKPLRGALSGWEKTGLVVGLIFLAIYWTKALSYVMSGDPWGHSNYWGQAVGTCLLIAVLGVGSIVYVATLWRFWVAKYFKAHGVGELKVTTEPTAPLIRKRHKRRTG